MIQVFISIITVFVLALIAKHFFKRICAVCASVSATWAMFLAAYHLGYFSNQLIIAVLMGGSSVGIYYLVEGKVKEELKVFRLPFLLTAFFVSYSLITLAIDIPTLLLLAALWVVFLTIYHYRNKPSLKKSFKKIIACCRDW